MDIKSIWNWLVTSSSDPEKTSIAVRGFLVLGSGYVLQAVQLACGVGIICLGIDASWLNTAINAAVLIATGSLYLIGGGMALFGLLRKVWHGRWSAAR